MGPHFNGGQGVYPMPGNQSSYETVATASGSGSSDPAGYQTPLSENSSMDRIAPLPPVKEPGESYGFNGFGGGPQYAPPGSGLQEQQMVVMAKLDKRMDIQHKSLKCSARNLRPEFQSSLESPIAMQVYHKMIRSDRR